MQCNNWCQCVVCKPGHDRHDHTLSTLQCHMVLMVLCILRTAMITPSPRCSAQAHRHRLSSYLLFFHPCSAPGVLCARGVVACLAFCAQRGAGASLELPAVMTIKSKVHLPSC